MRDGEHGLARIVLVDDKCEVLALLAVQQYRPAVVILDVRLPNRHAVELIRDIAAISEAKVIVFTATLRKAEIVTVLRSGAKAIVFKDQPASELMSCVREVLAEEPGIARHITTRERPRAAECGGVKALSEREREVAQWAAAGARNKEIAWKLGICEGTVKMHLFHAYRKFRVGNRVGLLLALGRAAGKNED